MKQFISAILFFLLLNACSESIETDFQEPLKKLSLEEIKREYAIADSLNRLKDRSHLNFETIILGIDSRNNQTIIRTALNRSFGCLMFTDYFTILYLNCDSVCCEKNGFWEVDFAGIAGIRTPVGCAPDTLTQGENTDCGCIN